MDDGVSMVEAVTILRATRISRLPDSLRADLRETVRHLPDRLTAVSRYDRTRHLAAANTVLAVDALAEAVAEHRLPGLSDKFLPDLSDKFLEARFSVPWSASAFDDPMQARYRDMVSGWGIPADVVSAITRVATSRYRASLVPLGEHVPEWALWFDLGDARATTRFDQLPGFRSTPLGHPGGLRSALARAHAADLAGPLVQLGLARDGFPQPTLAQGFVSPDFRVRTAPDETMSTGLAGFLFAHLTHPDAVHTPMLILGRPGSGKTVLARTLVARLPATDFLALRVPLCTATGKAITDHIAGGVARTLGRPAEWPILARSAAGALPVIVLDGLDEAAPAIGRGDYLQRVQAFQKEQAAAGQPVAVLVTCAPDAARTVDQPPEVTVIELAGLRPAQAPKLGRAPAPAGRADRTLPLRLALDAVRFDRAPESFTASPTNEFADDDEVEQALLAIDRAAGLGPAKAELDRLAFVAFGMLNRQRNWIDRQEVRLDLAALHPIWEPTRPYPPESSPLGWPLTEIPARPITGENRRISVFQHEFFADHLMARLIHRLLTLVEAEARPTSRVLAALLSFGDLDARPNLIPTLIALNATARTQVMWSPTATLEKVRTVSRQPDPAGSAYRPQDIDESEQDARLVTNLLHLCEAFAGPDIARRLSGRWNPQRPAVVVAKPPPGGERIRLRRPPAPPSGTAILFAPPDRPWAEWMAGELRSAGLTAGLDQWSGEHRPGRKLLLVSAGLAPATGDWTGSIVVRIDETPVPEPLRGLPEIDLTGLDEEAARDALLTGLGRAPVHRPPFPGRAPEAAEPTTGVDIAILTATPDKALADELRAGLAAARPGATVATFGYAAGKEQPARPAVVEAGTVLVTVSYDMLVSGWTGSPEWKELIVRHQAGRVVVFPVIARPCAWQRHGYLGRLAPLPRDGQTISGHANRHVAIRGVLDGVQEKEPTERTQVFICYSHKDRAWLDRVRVHLQPWSKILSVWSDDNIDLGARWEERINDALDRTKVAILLVSADMIASPFVQNSELPRLYAAEAAHGCRIVPVLVRPSSFADLPELNRFQGPNTDGKSLAELPEAEAEAVLSRLGRQVAAIFQTA